MKLPVSFFTLTRTTDELLSVHFFKFLYDPNVMYKKNTSQNLFKKPLTSEQFRTITMHESKLLNHIVTSLFLQISLAGEYDVTKWTHWFTMLLIGHSHHCLLHVVKFILYTVTCSSMYDVTVAFLKNSLSRGSFVWLRLSKTETIKTKKKTHTHHYHARYNSANDMICEEGTPYTCKGTWSRNDAAADVGDLKKKVDDLLVYTYLDSDRHDPNYSKTFQIWDLIFMV